jgi:hypothetical protein
MIDQITDLFLTTYKVKTQQFIKSRGQYCGDIELVEYLVNESGPVSLVLDFRVAHDRFGSSSDPSLNGNLHYPNNIDRSRNESSTSGRFHSEFVRLLFLQTHRETDRFFAVSGVQLAQSDRDQFHFRRVVFTQQLKSRVDLTLTKETTLRITLNLDGAPITSKSHTHPSHPQTSRSLTSSLSLGVPVPRSTQ